MTGLTCRLRHSALVRETMNTLSIDGDRRIRVNMLTKPTEWMSKMNSWKVSIGEIRQYGQS